jgi:cell division protein FtsI (penicillin-binding protein 3)
MSDRTARLNVKICAALLLLGMGVLGARLTYLHLFTPEALTPTEKSIAVRFWKADFQDQRGSIYDCHGPGNVLALDVTRQDLCADPSLIAKSNRVAEISAWLSGCLGLPTEQIAGKLEDPKRRYTRLARSLEEDTARQITSGMASNRVQGLYLTDSRLRHYPHGLFMCHVLGFVNDTRVGQAGVEQVMDKYLRGSRGLIESEENAVHREIYGRRMMDIPPLGGANITLTLDQNIQHIVEKTLDEVMIAHKAKGAWAIVQKVKTGEILAMASRPGYDLNDYSQAASDRTAMLNRSIGLVYEPGSTMKAIPIAAALNEGVVTPETRFDCEHGSWSFMGKVLRDYHPEGILTVADGIKKSSNILTAKVSIQLGAQRLYRYMRAFGLGDRLGLDLPGEERGLLSPVSQWSGISISRLPIGQGVAVTALQLLGSYCTIANGGELMRPFIVKRITAGDGALLFEQHPQVLCRSVSPATAATMRRLLARVTEEGGTGKRARIEGYEVAGKTGTAQKAVAGGYSSTAYVASFVGFLPAEIPEIGVIVVVDEPQPFHTGGVVAGPAFSRIVGQAVRYLDIPPSEAGAVARVD